jgi:hypothetical protein
MLVFRKSKCENSRDKAYDLLSLASKESSRMIHPNYSLSTEDIYKNSFLKHS